MALIDAPRSLRTKPQDIVLRVGGTCLLDEIDGLISVESGRAEIYGMVGETRCFLAEFSEGAILLGGGGGRLVVLAPDGARLSVREPYRPGAAPHDPDGDLEDFASVETWVRVLSDGISRYAPPRPDLRSLQPGETARLAAGEAACAGRGLVWLACDSAAVDFLGIAAAASPTVPVLPATWVVAAAPCNVTARTTHDVMRSEDWQHEIAAFHDTIALALRHRTERDREIESVRIEAREHVTRENLIRANERLVGVLSAKLPKTAEHADDIAFVLDLVTGTRTSPISDPTASLELRPALEARGLRARTVSLFGTWWRQDRGTLIGLLAEDGTPVALIPNWLGRYRLFRRGQRPRKVTAKTAAALDTQAIALARPLPNRPLELRNLAVIGLALCRTEIGTIAAAAFGASLLGLLLPLAIGQVIDVFIPDRLRGGVLLLGVALAMLNLCSSLLQFSADMARLRIDAKLSTAIQVGLIDRVLRLPSSFLKSQTSADLTFRVMAVDQIRRLFTNTVLSSAMAGIFGLTSFGLLFYYSAPAAFMALAIFGLFIGVSAAFGMAQLRALAAGDAMTVNLSSLTLQIIQNVSMLRAFGAERRAFSLWAQNTAVMRSRMLRARLAFIGFETFLACYDGLALAAVFAILGFASRGDHLSTGAYLAFVAAYQGFLVSSEGLGRAIVQVSAARPMMRRAALLLKETPESSDWAQEPGELRGEIEVSSASFAYDPESPLVLNNVSVRAEAGKFIAIAGPSGCGKSTLMGMILGFIQPTSGTVLYDGHDLATLNKAAVRRQIGVVRQGGRLIGGSVFENILGMHDGTIDDAWEAAEAAGIADDIRAMPMGLHTVLNEGVPTFSGGQIQRLLMARALVGKPKILLLDEATSALDNVTQAGVSASIERLGVTRIVIAHRLSTIRNADTIHFFDRGRVAESGTYEDLMARNGLFAAFASRQTL